MKKLTREEELKRAYKFVVKSHGSRSLLARELGLGRSWIDRFAQGVIKDPSYLRVCKILDYMKKYRY